MDSPLGLHESSLLALDEDENSPQGLDEILTQIRCQVDTMVPVDCDPNPVIIPLDSPPGLDEMLTQLFQFISCCQIFHERFLHNTYFSDLSICL